MCDPTEIEYQDGDVVWVKLGSCFWPGEVVGPDKLPPDLLSSFRKPPIAVVKFFQEDSYEYVKNKSCIYKYECSRKNEFINKGLYMYRTKHGHMEKFPEDVIRAETAVGGDKEILTRDEFQEVKKESYAGLFGKTPGSSKKGKGPGRPSDSPKVTTPLRKPIKEKSDYKVHILLQKKEVPDSETPSTPSTSRAGSDIAENKTPNADSSAAPSTPATPATPVASSGTYACPSCHFSTSRLNVLILHNKSHSAGYTAYTPSPVPKKPAAKPTKTVSPKINKTPKVPRQRKPKPEKPVKKEKPQGRKRSAEGKSENSIKKPKTDAEIKSSLLADWDDIDEGSNDESSEIAVGTESPAVPTPEDLPSALVPEDIPSDIKSDEPSSTDKPESSSDCKYDFCEDEDWHVEAGVGRKIPRVKNPKPKEGNKSLSLDEDEVAKEVAELLNKTALPELPSIPAPLKVEENFPEPSIVKSPDKKPEQQPPETKTFDIVTEAKPTKAIFKTKTFFRSRHSRSQDAIGKYIAEQLNAAERMDIVDSDLNGSDVVSFSDARESPPAEPVKVARLAPKIQLKKMKAEAAQLREKEKSLELTIGKPELEQESTSNKLQDVLWGTQEIKPINKETPEKAFSKEAWREEHSLQDIQFPKRKIFGHSPVKVRNEQESVISTKQTDLEESPRNVSNELTEIMTEKYTQPNVNTDEFHVTANNEASISQAKSCIENSINEVAESNSEIIMSPNTVLKISTDEFHVTANNEASISQAKSCIENSINEVAENNSEIIMSPNTSPENLNSKSIDVTPKGSRMNILSQLETVECDKLSVNTVTDTTPIKTKEDDQKSPVRDFDWTCEESDKKSPTKVVTENSLQKAAEISQRSPVAIDKSTTECAQDKQTFIENSPVKFSVNDLRSPIRKAIEKSVVQNDGKLPNKMDIESSPQKVTEITQSLPIPMEVDNAPIDSEDNQKSPLKSIDRSSTNMDLDSNTSFSKSKELQHNINNFSMEPFMSESTASAVDALLSVSRETDRVPRIVGNDPPEDLFEDDHKDSPNNDEEFLKSNLSQVSDVPTSMGEEIKPKEIDTTHKTNGITEENINNGMVQNKEDPVIENLPSESDLQIAEALINLPSTTIKNITNEQQANVILPINIDKHDIFAEEVVASEGSILTGDHKEIIKPNEVEPKTLKPKNKDQSIRFETEQEKSENFSAAQSLVQMSESVDLKINVTENQILKKDVKSTYVPKLNNRKIDNSVEQQVALLSNENNSDNMDIKSPKVETTSTTTSKLMKMLEEPSSLKPLPFKTTPVKQVTPIKQIIVKGKEKILNFDVAKDMKGKSQPAKQQIIIRRAGSNKGFLNNFNEAVASPDQIILSRSDISTDGSSVQTFTIQGPPPQESQSDEVKQIFIQPKIHKVAKTPTKLQKIKPQPVVPQYSEPQVIEESADMFDINSMPVVLSEDILTPESIEKMPIVMSDGDIIAPTTPNPPTIIATTTPNPPKLIATSKPNPTKVYKTKPTIIENEKITVSTVPKKSEVKTLVMSSSSDATKATTPNILSKSSKMRGGKPMLVIDKATGMQKIIMTKPEPVFKELKQATSLIQHVPQNTAKADKFIILPSANSPRPTGRTQKIVIDPQTGKAHMFIAKGQEAPQSVSENKPVSAKLIPSSSDASSSGNPTVMIITNAQGAQSRIVLTPEHEKILFPNKQQASGSHIKTITHRITTNPGVVQKTVVNTNAGVMQKTIVTSTPVKQQTKIVNKQKQGAIITSKGQLIVGGRVASTAQNIAALPEVRHIGKPVPTIRPVTKPEMRQMTTLDTRPTLKRIVTSEPKKLVQTIQKNSSEPLIFLQQKSGAVMQLTAAQFEHLQRTGQIVQKIVPPPEKKILLQPEKKIVPPPENKIVPPLEKKIVPPPEKKMFTPPEKRIIVQKSITIPAKDPSMVTTQKQRVRKQASATHTPAKRTKKEISIAPTHMAQSPIPPMTTFAAPTPPPTPVSVPSPAQAQAPIVSISSIIPNIITATPVMTTQSFSDLDNFEEMLPSTAIARPPEAVPIPEPQPEPMVQPEPEPEPVAEAPVAQLSDGQLLAVPGESVGGIPGAFYLCMEENGTFTPIDNRPLILENNQLVPIEVDSAPVYQQPERRDILEAALANSDVFHADTSEAPDFRDLNANVSVHCRVSETSTTLNQPIMTPVEIPSKGELEPTTIPSNLEDGLAVIGVTPHTVPTSLELPITVTDPRIAPKTTDPLTNNRYGTILVASPNTDMTYMSVAETETSGGISMPLLTDDESVGKSMPILTDEVAVSSVESMESEDSVGTGWARRLLTPVSDLSETSAEIPFQPHIQLHVADFQTNS